MRQPRPRGFEFARHVCRHDRCSLPLTRAASSLAFLVSVMGVRFRRLPKPSPGAPELVPQVLACKYPACFLPVPLRRPPPLPQFFLGMARRRGACPLESHGENLRAAGGKEFRVIGSEDDARYVAAELTEVVVVQTKP